MSYKFCVNFFFEILHSFDIRNCGSFLLFEHMRNNYDVERTDLITFEYLHSFCIFIRRWNKLFYMLRYLQEGCSR